MTAPKPLPEKRLPDTGMDFTIVVDTREQQPYDFDCATFRTKLEVGDYSVLGMLDEVIVERKSLSDFVSTVIHNSGRFRRELVKMKEYPLACVVVEADLDAVLRGLPELRAVAPTAVLGRALEISVGYRIPVFFCGSRQGARAFTDGYLRMAVRMRGRNTDE